MPSMSAHGGHTGAPLKSLFNYIMDSSVYKTERDGHIGLNGRRGACDMIMNLDSDRSHVSGE